MWLRENNTPWNHQVCSEAVENGHFHVLKWAVEEGCEVGDDIYIHAVTGNHLEIMKLLRSKNYPWNSDVCAKVAEYVCFDIPIWLVRNGCEMNEDTCEAATQEGNLRILKWAIRNGCD